MEEIVKKSMEGGFKDLLKDGSAKYFQRAYAHP